MKAAGCIFCEIAAGERAATILFENERVLAFKDIRPKAPTHVLIIPREHIATLNDITPEHQELMGEIFLVAKALAQQLGLAQKGYRTVFNCNRDAGQEVYHLHLHLMGGRQFYWPPG
ncbi:MAG: histidine triad nucleotide-binding protein [candidate division KSB1 bacterium]|nr:histidine triad nucleotide-binding protein [candidate division KSB1 bacterium]MDZ7318515.1 histidine triad nucleotide-binding protein [candidate division KSB1 bacterium]MDZ7341782.1 histidine triad nucleotide-binding protein [candidate division KSB1 bacterium]